MGRTIGVVTTSRADYSHLCWVLRELRARPGLDVRLIACAAQLSPEFGRAAEQAERDGIEVDERIECLLSSDTDVGMAKTVGIAVLGLAEVLGRMRPDLLLLIADRYELLAAASVALALRIPVAHIEGGEISEGAIDDAVRNAVTKLSHVHFTTTEQARLRVLALGEEPWRVHRSGAPSLDHLRRSPIMDRSSLESVLGVSVEPECVVVAYHPVTLARDTLREADELFAALGRMRGPLRICMPNADAGGRELAERVRSLCVSHQDSALFVNLPPATYWSLLRCAGVLVGNSSSGVMEAASVPLPVVNVGLRQHGRERARNVIDVEAETEAILRAVDRALSPAFRTALQGLENPYGDGGAAQRIAHVLASVPLGEQLLRKRAQPLPTAAAAAGPDPGGKVGGVESVP